jgi:prepilin-type N-terminal cleavage/methylation domain-containing protein
MKKRTLFNNGGFTLLEAVIALALLGLLTAGLTTVWTHVSRTSLKIITTQDAFENARVAMDGLLVNIQMAERIELKTGPGDTLQELRLTQNPPHVYVFEFNKNIPAGQTKHQRLELGGNEFASKIADIQIIKAHPNRMEITVISGGDVPVTLTGSVDIRYK